jgi:hypothetical protein
VHVFRETFNKSLCFGWEGASIEKLLLELNELALAWEFSCKKKPKGSFGEWL